MMIIEANENHREVWINNQVYRLEWDEQQGMWRSELMGKRLTRKQYRSEDEKGRPSQREGKGQFMTFWLPQETVDELEIAA